MSMINVLDKETINKIAAGEVVERPSSVVKELVENAIDAGSTAVTVEIKDGGVGFIRVTDNGIGIERDDIKKAFLRHSTSKIKCAEDLLCIGSLGFRGEALSSIAAVARVELITKNESEMFGIRYIIEGGADSEPEEIGCPDGTTFMVRDLFFNTPARRKFLKTYVTEAGYVTDLIEHLAFSRPDISFKYMVNGKLMLSTNGSGNLKDIIYSVYGREIVSSILPIEAYDENEKIQLSGYIGKPIINSGNRSRENYYVNGRFIKCSAVSKAIEDAYKPYLMGHMFPFTSMNILIPSDKIDVNVHPSKMEMRFYDQPFLYNFIYKAVSDTLAGKNMIIPVSLNEKEEKKELEEQKKVFQKTYIPEPFERKKEQFVFHENTGSPVDYNSKTIKYSCDNEKRNTELKFESEAYKKDNDLIFRQTENAGFEKVINEQIPDSSKDKTNNLEEISQIKKAQTDKTETSKAETSKAETYKTENKQVETKDAETEHEENKSIQEKITDERLIETRQVAVKQLEFNEFAASLKKDIRIVGQVFSTYWIAEYGNDMYLVDQHAAHEKVLYEKTLKKLRNRENVPSQEIYPPLILSLSANEAVCLSEKIDIFNKLGFEVEEFGGKEFKISEIPADFETVDPRTIFLEILQDLVDEKTPKTADILLEKIASMSCKAAVKGNNQLSYEEACKLIQDMLELDDPYHCPHGRPTMIMISKYELEKKFKRII